MTDDERFEMWGNWIMVIHVDVENAILNRHMRQEVSDIIDANPRIQIPSAFYDWIAAISADSGLMPVRRQLDKDPRSISLWRLLTDIIKYPDMPRREFWRRAVPRVTDTDPTAIQADLANLIKKTEEVERYATKRVAHYDKEEPSKTLIFQELDDVLDLIHELRVKYLFLLRGVKYREPLWTYDWKAIFREPWIQ